ncbi:MAG: endo-1,4-beta-xylanase [Treponema sp.]|jgi:endo-1,4-beta-xylanase|nr:endo-1,4-beta-xylanase [Treponema sp.]
MKKTVFAAAVFFAVSFALNAQSYNNITIVDSNFENGNMDGWAPRGDKQEKLEIVTDIKHGGASSLHVFNRSYTWHGPIHSLTDNAVADDIYSISAWIYFKDGPATGAFTFSVEKSFKDTKKDHTYQNVTSFQAKKGEWTEFKTEYTVGADPTQAGIWMYFELPYKEDNLVTPNDKIDFWIDDIKIVKLDPALRPKAEVTIPNLSEKWQNYFDIGTAVSADEVNFSSQQAQLLMKHFTVLVAGNDMKMETVQPKEGAFDWAPAERIIDFAEMTGMRLRWHPLVWHSQNPAWLFQDKANPARAVSKDALNQRLKTYIQTIMRRYRNRIESYDVVNEPLSDTAGLRKGSEGSKYYDILGQEYIDNAFRWAREADPNAQLVINEYGLEGDARKRQEMYNLVKGMKERKVPVDAVGLQMHIDIRTPSVQQIRETIELFASLGVKVLITEMDMSIYTGNSEAKKPASAAILLEQAQRYKDIFAVFREQSQKGNLGDMVVIWGASDNTSWKNDFPVPGRTDAPLLFDGRLQSKPAFWGLVDPSKVKGLK